MHEWWPAAAAATGLGMLLVLNIVSPEALAVRYNLGHRDTVERFDAAYLARLSDDAVPGLVAGLESLPPADRETVLRSLCRSKGTTGSGLAWNRARRLAANARATACGP